MKISAMKMQFYVSILSVLFVGVVSAQSSKNASKTNPNIIVFLVDDMGWQDTSLPFWTKATELNKRYHTPNMEKLAKEGMKFTNAYATPVCTPTRTSLLTGMNVTNHGVTNWTSPYKDNNSESRDEQMEPMSWNMNGLSPVDNVSNTVYATPFPKLLKEAGYFTVHVGKAHWGSMGTPGASPYNLGFMVNVSGHAAGHPQSYLAKDNYGNIAGKASVQAVPDLEEYYGSDTFLTEALTKEAIKSLDAPIRNKQPFFLNLSHYAVHDPIMGDNRFLKKYLDAGLDPNEAKYASLLEGMDKSLGDLMDFVKEKGIEKNTIIIFMSDNGGLSLTPPRGGLEHTQNLPLKAGKGSVYEGGIRVPMIVRWPEMVKPSTVANQYVIVEDFFPTILEIAKLKKYKTIQLVDGQSFLPILKNPNYVDNNRSLIWHSPHNWRGVDGPGINYYSAIRKGDWKLIYSMRTGKKELYNLAEDIGENNNLSDVNPVLVKSLSSLLSNVLRKNNAPMPSLKSTGKPVPMPDEVL